MQGIIGLILGVVIGVAWVFSSDGIYYDSGNSAVVECERQLTREESCAGYVAAKVRTK